MRRLIFCLLANVLVIATTASPQIAGTPVDHSDAVPFLLRHSGIARDTNGVARKGVVSITFSLYPDAGEPTPLWMETHRVVLGDDGRYSVLLGSHTPAGIPLDIFASGDARWLGVKIEGDAEGPRLTVVSVPYALKAEDANTVGGRRLKDFVLVDKLPEAVAAVVEKRSITNGAASSRSALSAQTSTQFVDSNSSSVVLVQQNGGGYGLDAISGLGPAIVAQNTASSGFAPGVMSTTSSSSGRAVYATAVSPTGFAFGVHGISASTSGVGVQGEATASTGTTFGVVGYAASPNGVGVKSYSANIGIWAEAFNSTGNTTGLIATSYSPDGVAALFANNAGGRIFSGRSAGVEKFAVDGSGNLAISGSLQLKTLGQGVVFPDGSLLTSSFSRIISTNDVGGSLQATQTAPGSTTSVQVSPPPSAVRGIATAQTDSIAGVLGQAASPYGYGVLGLNSAVGDDAVGIAGYSLKSPLGIGVYGEGSSTDAAATPVGVFGAVDATEVGSVGVLGEARAMSGDTTGVNGIVYSPSGYGVEGDAFATSGIAIGVAGFSDSDEGRGVLGNATATTGATFGVRGLTASVAGTGVAGVSTSISGTTIGISGEVASRNGVAGMFTNTSGSGDLLVGQTFPGTTVFRIDATGKAFFNSGANTVGADFAEMFAVRNGKQGYEPGDLLAIDETGSRRVKHSDEAYSTLVAGVYSTRPGVIAQPYSINSEQGDDEIPLAVIGVVPLKVTTMNGPIRPGDLLVSSPLKGHAMKGTDRGRMLGAVVGKALEGLTAGQSTIQVLVTLQ